MSRGISAINEFNSFGNGLTKGVYTQLANASGKAKSGILNKYYYLDRLSAARNQHDDDQMSRLLGGKSIVEIKATDVDVSRRCIGTGGFAHIHLGTYQKRTVAVKQPKSRFNPFARARTLKDLRIEALFFTIAQHPNVVALHGLCTQPPLLIMEYCAGGSMFDLFRRLGTYKPALEVPLGWARQVALAINHMHASENPIIHADLKASNAIDVTLRPDFNTAGVCRKCGGCSITRLTLKITDFGLTRSAVNHTGKRVTSGTVAWMAPELIEGKSNGVHIESNYSTQSDMWAYGVFLWECMTQRVPFNDCGTNLAYLITIGKKRLRIPDSCPAALKEIFEKCWQLEPRKRANATDVLLMLNKASEAVSEADWEWPEADTPTHAVENLSEMHFTNHELPKSEFCIEKTILSRSRLCRNCGDEGLVVSDSYIRRSDARRREFDGIYLVLHHISDESNK